MHSIMEEVRQLWWGVAVYGLQCYSLSLKPKVKRSESIEDYGGILSETKKEGVLRMAVVRGEEWRSLMLCEWK